ncbi:MAG: hypothetical protein ACTHK0_16045, partial [Ginsengibacter sp.]
WLLSAVNEQISRKLILLFSSDRILANAVSRRSRLIMKNLDKASKPDWVIGHNPGALYATAFAATKFNCNAGFDVEDYHPGEGNNGHLQNLSRKLMQEMLTKMNYVSFAAPLIMEEVKKDVTDDYKHWFTVLNFFPPDEFVAPVTAKSERIKMVWFSQNISAGRGLELILTFVKSSNEVELHLIGNINNEFFEGELEGHENIIVHSPVSQAELHCSLSRYDIGLALEPAKDRNNELAVSNKMLAYLQSGLYVIATNTPAQKALLNDFPGHGTCFDYQENSFEEVMREVLKNQDLIQEQKQKRFNHFRNRSWKEESVKLIKTWHHDQVSE